MIPLAQVSPGLFRTKPSVLSLKKPWGGGVQPMCIVVLVMMSCLARRTKWRSVEKALIFFEDGVIVELGSLHDCLVSCGPDRPSSNGEKDRPGDVA